MATVLCRLSELIEGQPIAVDASLEGAEASLVVVRSGSGVEAFLNICPHAGRRLDWAPGKFLMDGGRLVCAAHGASFIVPGGLCAAGPCKGQSLRSIEVKLDGDALVLK